MPAEQCGIDDDFEVSGGVLGVRQREGRLPLAMDECSVLEDARHRRRVEAVAIVGSPYFGTHR